MKAVILILNSHRDKLKNFLLLCKLVLISIFRDIKKRLKLYRVIHTVCYMGWVNLNLGGSPG